MEDQDLQKFIAAIMPKVQSLVLKKIGEIKQDILTVNKHKTEINVQIDALKTDQESSDQQIEALRKEIVNIRKQLQAIKHSQVEYKDLKNQIKLINKNIGELQQTTKKIQQNQIQPTILQKQIANSNKFEELARRHEINIKNSTLKKQQRKRIENYVDVRSEFIKRYKLQGRQIQLIDGLFSYQLLGVQPICRKKKNTFIMHKITSGMIDMGVIDPKHIKDRNSYNINRKQCVCYVGGNGTIYENGKDKKKGLPIIKSEDIVIMSVDGNTVTWKIGDQVYKTQNAVIKKQWVPFIVMYHSGDRIQWE